MIRPIEDYTIRRIRTVFGTVEVRNPRWMLCRNCHPDFVLAFAPLQETCPDRATAELTELTARLGSMVPYRQAASVMAVSADRADGDPCDRPQPHHSSG